MPTRNTIRLAVLGASAALVLNACAASAPTAETAQQSADTAETFPILQPAPVAPLMTHLDTMRAALPAFSLVDPLGSEVSVERMLAFDSGSPILSSAEVTRLVPLQAYLRNNPAVAVRVEGYFGHAPADDRSSLALDRAQAIVRALLTDMRVQNGISAVAAPRPDGGTSQAAIILIAQQSLDSLGLPAAP